jgi:SsrA-binding protein
MSEDAVKVIATNRRARHEYTIEDTVEAGMVLMGSEVKSLREGKVNMQDAYCDVVHGEIWLLNCHINPYHHGGYANHEPLRRRKLLLNRREIERMAVGTQQKGYTLIPLKMYFKNGRAKVVVGTAKGKKLYDKRHDIAERETQRRLERVMRRGE